MATNGLIGGSLGGFLANSFGLRSTLAVNGIALMTIGFAIPLLLRDHPSIPMPPAQHREA